MIIGPKTCADALTRLYKLPIHGEGTAYIESAASYLRRLSLAHCISIYGVLRIILRQETFPFPYTDDGYLMNVGSERLLRLCELMADATGYSSFARLTLEFLRRHISPSSKGLVRRVRAWCEYCMVADMKSVGETYDRLLWSLINFTCCPIHQLELNGNCWHCNSTQQILESNVPLDRCTKCGSSLCRMESGIITRGSPRQQKGNLSLLCVELMDSRQAIAETKNETAIADFFIQIKRLNCLSTYQMSKRLGIKIDTLLQWQQARFRPHLDYFLDACANLLVSPALVITDPLLAAQVAVVPERPFVQFRTFVRRKKWPKRNAVAIKRSIHELIASGEQASDMTVKEIAERLGVSIGTLYFHCRKELAQINRWRQERRENKQQSLEIEARKLIMRELKKRRATGLTMSQRAVVKVIREKTHIPVYRLRKAYSTLRSGLRF